MLHHVLNNCHVVGRSVEETRNFGTQTAAIQDPSVCAARVHGSGGQVRRRIRRCLNPSGKEGQLEALARLYPSPPSKVGPAILLVFFLLDERIARRSATDPPAQDFLFPFFNRA